MAAVDDGALRKLMADLGDDPAVMVELIDTFLQEGPRIMAQMREAVDKGDRRTLNRCAHSMKSTSATFGARELSRICRELEAATERLLPPEAAARVAEAEREWEQARAEIAAWKP